MRVRVLRVLGVSIMIHCLYLCGMPVLADEWMVLSSKGTYQISHNVANTGDESTVDIALNPDGGNVLHLEPNTQAELSKQGIRLVKGKLFILAEDDPLYWNISAPYAAISMERGGLALESSLAGDKVKIYSEFAKVRALQTTQKETILPEGFSMVFLPKGALQAPQRMLFEDYADWQQWVKLNYQRVDDTNKDHA